MKTNIQQEVEDIRTGTFHVHRRVSPRLLKIPKEKQPFYGSATRRHLDKDEVHCRKRSDDGPEEQFHYVEDEAKVDIDVRISPKQYVSKIRSEGHLSVQRVSPRLKDIPAEKRPYYGTVQRRQLGASRDNEYDRKTHDNKDETTITRSDSPQVQKMDLHGDILAQVVKYFSLHKGQHYGSNQKRKPDATNGDLCHRKHEDDDTSKQETKVGHSTQKCRTRMDVEGTDTEKAFALGLGSMEHKSTAVLDLEDKSYLEFIRCEAFLADNMHPRSAASVRESLVDPMVLITTGKDSSNCSHNSNKNEAKTESEMVDVTLRKNSLQNSQNMGLAGLPLERRVSPRFRNRPISKRPFYGSQKRKLSFPKDKSTIEKSRVDHLIQEWLPNVDRKNIGDRDTITLSDVKYENGGIMDFENEASLKSLGNKRFSAHQLCEKVDAKMKGTVRALDKHHPSIVQALQAGASKVFSGLPGLVCEDISYGKESMRIPATNLIDPPTTPADSGFIYITSAKVTKNVVMPPSPRGCNCKGNCTNPKYCSCARLNGSDFPYVEKDGGRLIEPKDVVFECGPRCGCGPNCVNRISQRGLKYQLEVYRTMNKGWAVRSWDFIPSGAFVCEYIGVIRKSSELDTVSENDFIFQIDCWQTMKEIGGRERRQGDVSIHARSLVDKVDEAECETEFCVDGAYYGNVTRFINHSCDPNLFVQCVLSSHLDIRLARIVLFAADDIPPMQELTYDYGYELDSVTGSDGQVKQLPCYCGTSECRGRLY
ncbi:Histone-lysine N-methyltransferase H3 lysine-9 specific SUVH4 [Euphorbia peplus]|nr:Histone-lysine N-methyltransferase H3 lysine-9 specific SUVH4 [Euphorbia peplus]